MTLTFNPWQAMVMTHTHAKIIVVAQLVKKIGWRQPDARTGIHDRSLYLAH